MGCTPHPRFIAVPDVCTGPCRGEMYHGTLQRLQRPTRRRVPSCTDEGELALPTDYVTGQACSFPPSGSRVHRRYFLPHLALAALLPISLKRFLDRDFARAGPPLRPPKRPRATACGFFAGSAGSDSDKGFNSSPWPGNPSRSSLAKRLERSGFFERSGIVKPYHPCSIYPSPVTRSDGQRRPVRTSPRHRCCESHGNRDRKP